MDSSGDVPNCVDGGPAANVFLAFSAKIIGNSMEVIFSLSREDTNNDYYRVFYHFQFTHDMLFF